MHIALVIEHMNPSRGGRERSIAEIATELVRRRCAVTIFCQTSSWSAEGVEICTLKRRGRWRLGRLRNFVRDVQQAINSRHFDIVHTTLPLPGANVYQLRSGTMAGQRAASMRRRREPGRTASAVGRSLSPCRRYLSKMERQLVARKDVVCLAVSELVAAELRTHYGKRNGVRVVYNAVDVPDPDPAVMASQRRQYREALGIAPDDALFVTLAMNFELKGVAETIRAFARWQQTTSQAAPARLAVIGRKQPTGYQKLARSLGIGNRVTFAAQTEDVRGWYAAADACVLLSWYDPCSRVILEATRFWVPSITTAHNGACEMLRNGAGIVVDSPTNVDAIAAAMEDVANRDRRRTFRQACLQVAGQLSTEHHVDQLLDVYSEILAGRSAAATFPLRVVGVDSSPYTPPLSYQEQTTSAERTQRSTKRAA